MRVLGKAVAQLVDHVEDQYRPDADVVLGDVHQLEDSAFCSKIEIEKRFVEGQKNITSLYSYLRSAPEISREGCSYRQCRTAESSP